MFVCLFQVELDHGLAVFLVDRDLLNAQLRDVGSLQPLAEKRLQVFACGSGKSLFKILLGGALIFFVHVQLLETLKKSGIANLFIQHIEDHAALVIADGPDCLCHRLIVTGA